jgi:hypothetical protein
VSLNYYIFLDIFLLLLVRKHTTFPELAVLPHHQVKDLLGPLDKTSFSLLATTVVIVNVKYKLQEIRKYVKSEKL